MQILVIVVLSFHDSRWIDNLSSCTMPMPVASTPRPTMRLPPSQPPPPQPLPPTPTPTSAPTDEDSLSTSIKHVKELMHDQVGFIEIQKDDGQANCRNTSLLVGFVLRTRGPVLMKSMLQSSCSPSCSAMRSPPRTQNLCPTRFWSSARSSWRTSTRANGLRRCSCLSIGGYEFLMTSWIDRILQGDVGAVYALRRSL